MPLTGTLGSTRSQPGCLQPGYAVTQGKVQWLGPFIGVVAGVSSARPGDTLNVGTGLAAQLSSADPPWWVAH